MLRIVDEFPANAMPFNEVQEVIAEYKASLAPSAPSPNDDSRTTTIYDALTGQTLGRTQPDPTAEDDKATEAGQAALDQTGRGEMETEGKEQEQMTVDEGLEYVEETVHDMKVVGRIAEGHDSDQRNLEKGATASAEQEVKGMEAEEEKSHAETKEDEKPREAVIQDEIGVGSVTQVDMEIDGEDEDRLVIKIKKRKHGDEDYKEDKDVIVDDDDYEAYLAKIREMRPQKRQRLGSKTVWGDGSTIAEGDDRPTLPSPHPCNHCTTADEKCLKYILPRSKGERPRTACRRCYKLKKKCSFNAGSRRRAKSRTPAIKGNSDEDLVKDEEVSSKRMGKRRDVGRRDKGKRRASEVKKVKTEDDDQELEWEQSMLISF